MIRRRIFLCAVVLGFAAFFGTTAVANASITKHYGEEATATFVVPPGITSIQVVAIGGRGGRNGGGGTVGAKVQGTFSVTPGASLGINVAGSGTNCTGGKNGGGSVRYPCQQSGGGGGASDIRTAAVFSSRIMVAAGGGGWGGNYGTAAGGNAGAAGTSDCVKQAQPGTQVAGGAAGGTCEFYNPATAGSLGQGGTGGNYLFTPDYAGDSGGGGGGGYYGGGGASGGGGAGGSSLTSAGGTIATASASDNPYIDITYSGFTLNVSTNGTGSGFITSTPAGIDCGRNVTGHSDCSQEFEPGEEITLEANGGLSGYTGCTGSDQTCTVTMDQNRTVTGTFGPASPGLTLSNYDVYLTEPISISASLQGGRNTLTGTITFRAFGLNDTNCSGTPVYSNTVTVDGAGDYYSGYGYTPTQPGTYRWTANYSGNSDNNPVSVACNGPNATTTVVKVPYYPIQSPTDVSLGGTISNTANFDATYYPDPTGTVRFYVYPPSDTECSGTPSFTSDAVTVDGRGSYGSGDFTPTEAGTYFWIVVYSGDSNFEGTTSYCGSYVSTVSKAGTSLSSSATSATIGSPIADTATLSGGQSATGTLTFRSYGPDDVDCSGTPAFAPGTVPVNGDGDYGSGEFTPTLVGAYRWTASYSGDSNNAPATSPCNSTNGTSTVSKAVPVVALESTSDAIVGTSVSATGSLASGYQPTGTITFTAYGPDDNTCSDTAAYTDSSAVDGNDEYDGNVLPTRAGNYHWIIEYSGDSKNQNATTACSTITSNVAKSEVSISTSAIDAAITEPISDIATITGGYLTTGTIDFELFGPYDADCSGTSVFNSTITVDGNDDYGSGDFTPTTAGDYRWTADYSGDENNEPASSPCNAPGETSTVAKAEPTIETTATNAGIGSPISDTAVITGGENPGGTVTFKAYGPDDADCSVTAAFSVTVNVTGNGNYGSGDFSAAAAGVYRWTADYSGDLNNEPAISPCNAPGETSTVGTASPTITSSASDAVIGTPVSGTAAIAAGVEPGGTVTFKAFGVGDIGCASAPVFTRTVAVDGNGEYGSGDFIPEAVGTYLWTADYSGDGNNEATTTQCVPDGASSEISKASPVLDVAASGDTRLGDPVSGSATISTGFRPSGTVSFALYGPNDTTCSADPVFEASVPAGGNGKVNSPEFTPAVVGDYRWVAGYSGDGSNNAVTADCTRGKTTEVVPLTCPAVKMTAVRYKPAVIRKGNKARGVRARIKVSRPSLLKISAGLRYTWNGKSRKANLGDRYLRSGGTRSVRIVLPKRLRSRLPLGSTVELSLKITATPREPKGCTSPPTTTARVKTRVVWVLRARQR